MKLWHQKLSENQIEIKKTVADSRVDRRAKMTYRWHQFLIWAVIFSIAVLIVNFFKTNTNFN